MATVSAGTTASVTLTGSNTITISCDPTEKAFVSVMRGAATLFSGQIGNANTIGPYLTGDVLTVTANRGDVDYTLTAYTAPTTSVPTASDTGSITGGTTLNAANRYYHTVWVVNGGGNVPLAEDLASSGLTLAFEAGVGQPPFTISFAGSVTVIQENGATLSSAEADGGMVLVTCQADGVWRVLSARYNLATLAADSAGRALVVQGGHVLQSAKGALRGSAPILYRSTHGAASRFQNMQAAVGYSGNILAVDNSGTFWKRTAAGGVEQVSSTGAIPGTTNTFFVHSSGTVFYSVAGGVGNNKPLWRSTDGGATWAVSLTFTGTDDYPAPMAEDSAGNIVCPAYGQGASGVALSANSRAVMKSTDVGANWTNMVANVPGGAAGINRHVHGAWWDPYRSLWFITTGDSGTTSKIHVSADGMATFTTWTNSAQATAMAFTPTHVLYAADQSGDRRIYRAAATSLATVTASTPQVCMDWVVDMGDAYNGGGGGIGKGYAWQGFTDNQGNVVFCYGSEGVTTDVMASSDSGATWARVLQGATGGNTYHAFAQVSPYNTGRDGFQYNLDTVNGNQLSQWRVYAPGTVLPVAYDLATEYTDGITAPLPRILDYGLEQPGIVQRLSAAYPEALRLCANNAVIDTQGYTLGVAETAYPLLQESFDGVTAPAIPAGLTTSFGGTGSAAPVTSASSPLAGVNSLVCVVGTGTAYSQIRHTVPLWALAQGGWAWMSFMVSVDTITATQIAFLEFNALRIGAVLGGGVKRLSVFNSAQTFSYQQPSYGVLAFPEGTAARVLVQVKMAPNTVGQKNGVVRVWQDTGTGWKLVIHATGMPTYVSLSQNAWFGGYSLGSACTVKMKDIRYGVAAVDHPPALVLSGSQQSVPRLGLYR